MQITKRHWVAGGVGFVVAVGAYLGWSHWPKAPVAPLPAATNAFATSTASAVSSTVPVTTASTAVQPFPINPADTIASWSFKGGYVGNDGLIAQANADIAHLAGLLGKGQYDDYVLYNGIGNDDNLLGDGQGAYRNYNRAIALHPDKGLVYTNLAHLMDQLGAYDTAADAYAKATAVEPGMLEYHIERLDYLTRQFPDDNARITAALTDASKRFGDSAPILTIEAQWLTGQKRYADAIKAWQTVEMLSPGQNTSAIDAAIAALKAKE